MAKRQKTIGIDGDLWISLDEWIATEQARKRGIHSKAQFANMAISDFLTQYRDSVFTTQEMLRQLQESHMQLAERIDQKLAHLQKLELFWMKHNFKGVKEIDGLKNIT